MNVNNSFLKKIANTKYWHGVKRRKYLDFIIIGITTICCIIVILYCYRSENIDTNISPNISEAIEKSKNEFEKPDRKSQLMKSMNENEDAIAWVTISGTTIDWAVMQRKNDYNNYYLRRNENGKYAFEGCIFSDNDSVFSPIDKLSNNLILHGHNLDDNPNGKRFAQLVKFQDIDFAKKTPYIFLTTKDKSLVYQIYAVYFSDIKFGYTSVGLNEDSQKLMIDEAKQRSEYVYDVETTGKDKIITLSTCTYKYGKYGSKGQKNTRFVVQGKLLNEQASLEESISLKRNTLKKSPNIN